MSTKESGITRRNQVILKTQDDVIFWCARFAVTPLELRRAISQAGVEVDDVQRLILEHRKQRPSSV
ncbi:Protein of unknown function [Pseudoxanthomonas sp. GM95]|uniref:DUF3606 domain-containing protein n=1 Tax=Pseudoxanthomonas sp. GM95 TaxID=1881043 RepID=UPI0008D558BE|nr:DUF3606 domain-containing protein [Pseudoxanthomonas sp. GM95]SEL16639.1 Protein of unknown function [Pseudoxanthomonas sp. GM95]